MAANLEKVAGWVETFIRALEKAMNPTSGTPQPGLVKQRGQDLRDKWTAYDALYQDMEYDEEAREAAENEYMDKYERYSIALGSASDILEAASSGAESVVLDPIPPPVRQGMNLFLLLTRIKPLPRTKNTWLESKSRTWRGM